MRYSSMTMKLLLLLVAGTFATLSVGQRVNGNCQCGVENLVTKSRIINGIRVRACKYPWMVFLVMRGEKDGRFFGLNRCTGSVINDKYIVTAAHCLKLVSTPDDINVYITPRMTDFQ